MIGFGKLADQSIELNKRINKYNNVEEAFEKDKALLQDIRDFNYFYNIGIYERVSSFALVNEGEHHVRGNDIVKILAKFANNNLI